MFWPRKELDFFNVAAEDLNKSIIIFEALLSTGIATNRADVERIVYVLNTFQLTVTYPILIIIDHSDQNWLGYLRFAPPLNSFGLVYTE